MHRSKNIAKMTKMVTNTFTLSNTDCALFLTVKFNQSISVFKMMSLSIDFLIVNDNINIIIIDVLYLTYNPNQVDKIVVIVHA